MVKIILDWLEEESLNIVQSRSFWVPSTTAQVVFRWQFQLFKRVLGGSDFIESKTGEREVK